MRKRATETRLLPDPTSFGDWRQWARQLNNELQRQLLATSMVLPFFEFATLNRTTDFTLTGFMQLVPWQQKIYDNTTGGNPAVWDAGDPTTIYVPRRPGNIQYGYAMLMIGFAFSAPGAALNDVEISVDYNSTFYAPPSGFAKPRVFTGGTNKGQLIQPWIEVNPGDWFEVYVGRTGSGTANIVAHPGTYCQLVLAGPQ